MRHLCDWAVFVSHFTDDQFTGLFEDSLKKCGLWRFAQILTQTSVKYLHLPRPSWVTVTDENILRQLIGDIMSGGNFGHKDPDRTGQTKFIASFGKNTLDRKPTVFQILSYIRDKSEAEGKTSLAFVKDHLSKLLSGDRSPDSKNTLKQAAMRKKLYLEFHLFEP